MAYEHEAKAAAYNNASDIGAEKRGRIQDRTLEARECLFGYIDRVERMLNRVRGSVPTPASSSSGDAAQVEPSHLTFLLESNVQLMAQLSHMLAELSEHV